MSASRRVYLCLRQRIVEMNMLPGARIVERDIAEEFGTSRTPVHEAVQRLADEGLIEVVPRSGTFVARIPLDAWKKPSWCVMRSRRRSSKRRRSACRPTRWRGCAPSWRAGGRDRGQRPGRVPPQGRMFHAALAELSGYPGVWPIILQAKTQMDRYRQLTLPLEGRMGEVLAEHRGRRGDRGGRPGAGRRGDARTPRPCLAGVGNYPQIASGILYVPPRIVRYGKISARQHLPPGARPPCTASRPRACQPEPRRVRGRFGRRAAGC